MKFISILLSLASLSVSAQNSKWLWPIEGAKTGENIVCQPQDRIDKELNIGNLFIAAPEGTTVVAPVDGTIGALYVVANTSLKQSVTYGNDGGTFDKSREKLANDKKLPMGLKYINGSIMLRLADGRKLYISGLRGNIPFKTGQRITKGQKLGTVAYDYRKIAQPHISISVSGKDGKNDDPMTPFGLKTTFKKIAPLVIPKTLTVKQANEDFDFLVSSIKECYPSFDDIISEEKYQQFVSSTKEKLKTPISYNKFYQIVRSAFSMQFLHDSHAWLDTDNPMITYNYCVPHLFIGSLNGKLIVTQAQTGYEKYLGKEVSAIDGVDAKMLIEKLRNDILGVDGDNQSAINEWMITGWNTLAGNNLTRHLSVVKLADGSVVRDQWISADQVKGIKPSTGKTAYYQRRNANQKSQYRFTMKTDRIALLTISDFTLDEVQMEAIADSLMRHKNVPNLIIDVRNNPGGHIDVCNRLVSWFIDKPTKETNHYDKVNSNGIYQSFVHCMNIPADDKPFEDYVAREGQTGFYSPSSIADVIYPDSSVHYGGRVIILTDETSKSAASDFPAILVRNGRAITVGRETGTGYHYMTAVKFAHLALPHSHIEYTLPLVKSVADDTVSDRFPAKRGLMPDVEVPLTYDEIYAPEGDPIMEKALEVLNAK